jgi:hypothetical protein
MALNEPNADAFRTKLFAFLEEEYDLKIGDLGSGFKVDDGSSRDMPMRIYQTVQNAVEAANMLVRRLYVLLPDTDLPPRSERANYRRQSPERNFDVS